MNGRVQRCYDARLTLAKGNKMNFQNSFSFKNSSCNIMKVSMKTDIDGSRTAHVLKYCFKRTQSLYSIQVLFLKLYLLKSYATCSYEPVLDGSGQILALSV